VRGLRVLPIGAVGKRLGVQLNGNQDR
jgi:hypothetical protein